jgi:hypothetical protein
MSFLFSILMWAGLTLVLIKGWSALPLIIYALNPTSIRSRFLNDAAAQKMLDAHPLQMETVAELKEMGFVLLGVRGEKLPLWGMEIPGISLALNEAHTYASVLFSAREKPVGIYFFTPLKDGGMVFTRNQAHQPEIETGHESVKNVVGVSALAVYAVHLSRLRALSLPESAFFDVHDKEARHAAAKLFYATVYGRQQVRKFLSSRTVRIFWLTLVVFFFFFAVWLISLMK